MSCRFPIPVSSGSAAGVGLCSSFRLRWPLAEMLRGSNRVNALLFWRGGSSSEPVTRHQSPSNRNGEPLIDCSRDRLSSSLRSQKIKRAKMRYKRSSRVGQTFSIPQFQGVLAESDFQQPRLFTTNKAPPLRSTRHKHAHDFRVDCNPTWNQEDAGVFRCHTIFEWRGDHRVGRSPSPPDDAAATSPRNDKSRYSFDSGDCSGYRQLLPEPVTQVPIAHASGMPCTNKARSKDESPGLQGVWHRCLSHFCGPTRSFIGGTLVVSQVKARQPSRQPSSMVASMDWWL